MWTIFLAALFLIDQLVLLYATQINSSCTFISWACCCVTFSRSLSQNKALQGDTRPDLFFFLFCDNDWLNAHYPLHKQRLPYGIYAASFAQRLLCTTKKVTLRGGWKGHGPRVSLRNYRHSNLLPFPALMTETELPS